MDRIGSDSSSNTNTSYEPNTCEAAAPPPPPREPVATCFDGSVAYDAGVCATTGLKGPPTAAQQYVANLGKSDPESSSATPSPTAQPSQRDMLQQMVTDASKTAMAAVEGALADGSLEANKEVEYSIELPNGAEAKVGIVGSMALNADGTPELAAKLTGKIEAKVGALSAEAELSYARGPDGKESISVGACLFGGVDQEAGDVVELEAKAGLCATYSDARGEPALLQLDAVGRAGASIGLGGAWSWGHEVETRTVLSREPSPYEFLR